MIGLGVLPNRDWQQQPWSPKSLVQLVEEPTLQVVQAVAWVGMLLESAPAQLASQVASRLQRLHPQALERARQQQIERSRSSLMRPVSLLTRCWLQRRVQRYR